MKVTKDIHELILAYLQDDISEEEMSRLREWLAESERHQSLDCGLTREEFHLFK